MNIKPTHLSVGQLFSHNLIFRVPKYQRYYSWASEEIDDFLKDLDACRKARQAQTPRPHFFGGLVTVSKPFPGSARQNLEVIDGQQRLASFVMLVVQLRRAMEKLSTSVNSGSQPLKKFLKAKANTLVSQYETFMDTINLEVVPIPRLELSKPDKDFFTELLSDQHATSTRESHKLLAEAYKRIGQHLDEVVATEHSDKKRAEALAVIAEVLEEDWTVIHMATHTRTEAYMLFQVLNDRGMGLTEGELLRAKTLEVLDSGGTATQQQTVENSWDDILGTEPERIEQGLRWLFSSHKGSRPGKTTLFDDCLDFFFPMHRETPLSKASASKLTDTVLKIQTEFRLMTKILEGSWPYTLAAPVSKWDADRLRLLVVELKHTNCIPLLVSACQLTQKQFAEIVQMLERFVFRYKAIVNAHIGPATSVYQKHALEIRNNPKAYQTKLLRQALEQLLALEADDSKFRTRLSELEYSRATSNKPLKYFLMTLEHYAAWYSAGAKKSPACMDKSRIFDFSNGTIEHVYPANAALKDAALEPLIDSLGNLTILGPGDNGAIGNQDFSMKKAVFGKSNISINRTIADSTHWNVAALNAHKERLLDMALKVFVP
ncbi:DUF262 domain-containing protein [Trinickia mobilis]|uniref:DUF262 domain-containing protein n=1 Tax=Trinickia mobilis TaxID=2816356 RepID=UPI001A8C1BEB|nr:DUF262 domain-containing protein [Trinickia mobilis]